LEAEAEASLPTPAGTAAFSFAGPEAKFHSPPIGVPVRGEMIAFGQPRRQMIVVSAVPVADISVTVGIAVVTVSMPVAMTMIVVRTVIVVAIVLIVAVAIALSHRDGAGERQSQQRDCASAK